MGMFKKKVKVSNSKNPKQFFEEEFWVDTGALFSCSERQPWRILESMRIRFKKS